MFDSLNPLTLLGLRGVIKGEAASIQGRSAQANRTLKYLAPGLASTSNLTAELDRNEPAFDGLLVEGAQTMQALASRAQQLSDLIVQANTTTGAVARQSVALQQALQLLPNTLNRSTATFAGLDSTLDALDPLVAQSKIASRRLEPFAASLNTFTKVAIPTVTALSDLIHNPAGTGDLTSLFEQTPGLAKLAATAFPNLITSMNASQTQLDALREYAPDVVAALTNVGQAQRLLRRQRALRPRPADVLRVRHRQLERARLAQSRRPLPGPAEGHLALPRWRRSTLARWLLAGSRQRLRPQLDPARAMRPEPMRP